MAFKTPKGEFEPDWERWDREIARDAGEGKLDFLLGEARNTCCCSSVDECKDAPHAIFRGTLR